MCSSDLLDAIRYRAGLPWDRQLIDLALPALRQASPLLVQVADQLQALEPYLPPDQEGTSGGSAPGAISGLTAPSPSRLPDHRGPAAARKPSSHGLGAVQQADGPTGFSERLGWYAEQVAHTLQSGVPDREPRRHLYEPIRGFLARAGKGLRPALCLATTRALEIGRAHV